MAQCLQATEAQTLRQTTAAIRDVAFVDKNRDLVLEFGGLEALALCLDKCEDKLLSHLERELPTLRKHVAQALQNLTLSYKVRKRFIENGLVERIMALCQMQDMDKKLTTPNHVLGYAIAALANVSHLYEARTKLLDLGVAGFLSKMLDLCKNGLVTMHVCIAIRNLALRKASPDFQRCAPCLPAHTPGVHALGVLTAVELLRPPTPRLVFPLLFSSRCPVSHLDLAPWLMTPS